MAEKAGRKKNMADRRNIRAMKGSRATRRLGTKNGIRNRAK